jgi:hypothetical protein
MVNRFTLQSACYMYIESHLAIGDRTTTQTAFATVSHHTPVQHRLIKLLGISYKFYIILRIGSIDRLHIYFCDVMSCSAFTILGPNGYYELKEHVYIISRYITTIFRR